MSVWDTKKKSQSMLWGRSDLQEKFYSGEKASNPWVRDLLWKKNITDEHKKFGDDPSPMDLVPPHMRSVTLANVSASMEMKDKRRRKRQMQQMAVQSQGMGGQQQQRPNTSQSYREYAVKHSARSQRFGRSPSARSIRSSHSMQSLDSSATLGQFTQLLHAQNAKLENDLILQQQERERLENKISSLENLVRTSVLKSSKSQQRTEKRLQAYKLLVNKLVEAKARRGMA
eukprot:g7736.t1